MAGPTPTDIGLVVAAVVGVAGTSAGVYVAQRNRRQDRREVRETEGSVSRVQDSKNALDAWMAISAANTTQIATLNQRVESLVEQLRRYEETIVPTLETKVAEQQQLIAELTGKISELESTILELRSQLETLRKGGTA